MPLLDAYQLPDVKALLGIWKVDEPVTFFENKLTLFPQEAEEVKGLKDRKRMEWFCSRYLLHVLSDRHVRGACLKDAYGKPYLEGSDYHISMSHSEDRTAVIASPHRIGIDIQRIVEKITRIAPRFLSENEMSDIDEHDKVNFLHFYWGAKEAMYKIYGKKEVDFKKHLALQAFEKKDFGWKSQGVISKDEQPIHCQISAHLTDEFVLVYAWEVSG